MNKVVLGIDIGGTNTVYGLIEQSGHVLFREQIPTFGNEPAQNLANRLREKVDYFLEDHPDHELTGVGVGAPNGNHFTGVIQDPPNLNWGDVDIVSILKKKFSYDIILTNDANAAALGEKKFGIAKDMNDFVMITLGTGLGSGIFTNGSLLYGYDGFAGEMGHLSIDPEGRLCNCGRTGCLEMYVSAKGIRKSVNELKVKNPDDTFIQSLPEKGLDGRVLDKAFDAGERAAIELYQFTGEKLGIGLAQAATLLSPEAFIIYGGYSNAGERLLEPARRAMDEYLLSSHKGKILILQSSLPQSEAGIIGAASLIWSPRTV